MMQAVNSKIIVEELNVGQTEGGIALPDHVNYDKPGYRVVSVGEGRLNLDGTRTPICVEVGDYILVGGKASGFPFQGKEYLVMEESQIAVIIKKADYNPGPNLNIT